MLWRLRIVPGLCLLSLAALSSGCQEDAALFVDVRTDLVPDVEFTQAVFITPDGDEISTSTQDGQDWIAGARVFEAETLDAGDSYRFVIELQRGTRTVLSRPVRVELDSRLAVTIALTRDCRGSCYDDGDQQACLNGQCVADRCTDATLAECGAPACAGPSDCVAQSPCAVPVCVAGSCLFDAAQSACGADELCSPDVGCVTRQRGDLPTVDWTYFPTNNTGRAFDVDVDDADNIYVTGGVSDDVDFGGGELDADGADPFVLALDPDGNHRWSTVINSPDADDESPDIALAIDVDTTAGMLAVAGRMSDDADFGGMVVPGNTTSDLFLATMSLDGTPRWLNRLGGDADEALGAAVAVGSDGRVYAGGHFDGSIDIGGTMYDTVDGSEDLLLVAFSSDGMLDWGFGIGEDEDDRLRHLTVTAAGELIGTGRFEGDGDFGVGVMMGGSSAQTFLTRWNATDGAPIDSWNAGLDVASTGLDVAMDSAGNYYIAGHYRSTHTFGGRELVHRGSSDGYLFSLTPDLEVRWVVDWGSPVSDSGSAVLVDGNDNVWITGEFEEVTDFGGGPVFARGLGCELFVASYDSDGNNRFTQAIGTTRDDEGHGLALASDGGVILVGRISPNADFGTGPVEAGGLFVVRLSE